MSESAEYRSKRKFCAYLKNNPWQWQYTVFYSSMDSSQKAIEHSKALRRLLHDKYTLQPFLWRLCLRLTPINYFEEFEGNEAESEDPEMIVAPFHTLFTTEKLRYGPLSECIADKLTPNIRLRNRQIDPFKVEAYCRAVMRERPHDLKKLFGDKKINRFSLINKASLPG